MLETPETPGTDVDEDTDIEEGGGEENGGQAALSGGKAQIARN